MRRRGEKKVFPSMMMEEEGGKRGKIRNNRKGYDECTEDDTWS